MTKRESLEQCARLWRAIAESPVLYLGIKVDMSRTLGMPRYVHYCPCCQYVTEQSHAIPTGVDDNCCQHHCPLRSLWPSGCSTPDGAYRAYVDALCRDDDVARAAALEIAEAAEKELAKEMA